MNLRPNIVLIVADDMGYGDFGLYSEGRVDTPALDQLAADSLRLVQHYAGSPVCSPSRAALLTGRYPHRTGAVTPQETLGYDRIAQDEATLADSLHAAGYATGLIGKWHNGALDSAYHPNRRGFDEFIGFCGGWMDYYQWWLDRNGAIEHGDGRYLTEVLSEEAISFIRRHREEPFFLTVAYNAPHSPLQAPEEVTRRYEERGFPRAVALTYAMIEVMDRGVASIREELSACGLSAQTIVMFTSDNGPAFRMRKDQVPPDVDPDTRRFNCGLNGAKGSVYEGGIRVPMLVHWPEGLPGNREVHALVHFTDWLPTLLSAAGATPVGTKAIDGIDYLGMLRNGRPDRHPIRFWQWNAYSPIGQINAAVREGDWKLVCPGVNLTFATAAEAQLQDRYTELDIRYKYHPTEVEQIADWPEPVRIRPEPLPPQLFNLSQDPGEQSNLASEHPERARSLLHQLEKWFEEVEQERLSILPAHLHPTPVMARFSDAEPG